MKKLAIVVTHPIQYNAPVFQRLTERGNIELKVFYTWEQAQGKIYDADFKREIAWDIPLLEGYSFTFVKNIAPTPGLHHFRGIDNPSLLKEIEVFGPDAILVYGWNFKSHFKAIRYFKNKIPVLFRGDSTLIDDVPGIKSILRKLFLTWVYSHIDKALFVGQRNKDYFMNNGLKSSQLSFAPHAIDNKRFSTTSENNTNGENCVSRSSLGIAKDELVFLFAGKLEPKKNPLLLIQAYKELKEQHVHLIIVGNGVLEVKLKQECIDLPNVHFLDFQNQTSMPSVYALADVFVLPSAGPGETWGLAINEAMACGKAILASDKCGCAVDLIENHLNGFIFKSKNKEDILGIMRNFSNKSKEELRKMGLASYVKIQDWNFDCICDSIESSVNVAAL